MAHGTGRPGGAKDKRLHGDEKTQLKSDFGSKLQVRSDTDPSQQRNRETQTSYVQSSRSPKKSPRSSPRKHKKGSEALEMGIKNMEIVDEDTVIQTVEILKRPGQTLGFYIREGNGMDRHEGVFISRIASGSVVENNGLLRIGDEILTVNSVDVTHTSLDDVVILMSIPKRLVLTIRTRRGYSKNASCPSLVTEEERTPVVVLKQAGRLAAAGACEMTEKCPDEFILAGTEARAYYAKQAPGYMQKLEDAKRGKGKSSSAYKPLHIGVPHQPQQGDKLYQADDSGDSGLSSENSGYSARVGDGTSQSQGSHFPTNTHAQVSYQGASTEERAVDDVIHPHDTSWPDGELQKRSPKLSPREPVVTFQSPVPTHRVMHATELMQGYHPGEFHLVADADGRLLHERATSENYVNRYSPRQYDVTSLKAYQEELERTHYRYEGFVNTRHKFSKSQRSISPSPECYNSDSEVAHIYQMREQDGTSPGREKDQHIAAVLDEENRSNSLPRMDGGESSEEIDHWLRKFDTLSHELQGQEESLAAPQALQLQPGNFVASGSLSQPGRDTYTSEEYWSWLNNRMSPSMGRKFDGRSGRMGHPRVTRKHSADSLLDYRTYQMLDDSSDLSQEQKQSTFMQSLTRAHRISHSYTSLSNLATVGLSTTPRPRQSYDLEGRNIPPPSSRIRDLQLARKPLQIKMEEFVSFKPEVENKKVPFEKAVDGLLSVHIYCGNGLKSSKTMLRDLYCVIEVDSVNKARTMIRTGAINFDWDEAFDVDLENAREISFLIYSWDPNTRHRLCFSGLICLQALLQNFPSSPKVALKLEPKGVLFLDLKYKEPAVTLQRTPSIRKNAVFGVDLETLIKREKTGYNVPILVKKCIEEVERRGLDHVGIYRLCGSAKRKTQLREEFERSSRLVDLSPDNVSDINVITGVLKDFLRELPEPLFTNALYQMLLDALSVRLPGDPDGSAKLMLSILECLPKANQDTMAMLLDHLKRVSLKSDVNKMNPQNLAVCFGPVLLCPSPQSTTDVENAMDFKRHIEVLNYLLEIWPDNREELSAQLRENNQEASSVTKDSTSQTQTAETGWEHEEVSSC